MMLRGIEGSDWTLPAWSLSSGTGSLPVFRKHTQPHVLLQLEIAAIKSNHFREIRNPELLDDGAIILKDIDRAVVRPGQQDAGEIGSVADRAQRQSLCGFEVAPVAVDAD